MEFKRFLWEKIYVLFSVTVKMSTPGALRDICVRMFLDLLKSGAWDMCHENPFSCLPIPIVQDILSSLWPEGSSVSRRSIGHSRLLFRSGRLEHFELPCTKGKRARVKVLRILSRGCQSLRRLSLLKGYEGIGLEDERDVAAERSLEEPLHNCPNLQCLHSGIYFEPNVLRKCIYLRILKLHFSLEVAVMFYRCITYDLLKRLGSMEMFCLCQKPEIWKESQELRREIVSILDTCRQLTSLGSIDALATLKELHDRDTRLIGTPRQFKLRGCYWEAYQDISQSEY